jgi:hypothetical protein
MKARSIQRAILPAYPLRLGYPFAVSAVLSQTLAAFFSFLHERAFICEKP